MQELTSDQENSLLKQLREKKKISRTELSKRTRLSTYQIEGLEGLNTQSFLVRIFSYLKGLGYKSGDFARMIESGNRLDFVSRLRGSLLDPLSETVFREGVKLFTYLEENELFLGSIQLATGQSLKREKIRAGMIIGIVREGVLVIDFLVKQAVYKKDHFFIFPENCPFEFVNGDSFSSTTVLILSIAHPIHFG